MAAFAGLIDFEGGTPDRSLLLHAGAAFPDEAFGEVVESVDGGFGFVIRPLRAVFDPPVFERPVAGRRYVAVGDTRIDDRSELVRSLGDPALSGRDGDGALVLAAIEKWGRGFAERLTGEFAIAAWDREERTLLLARDHFGARPLFYARLGRRVAFASSMLALRRLAGLGSELNPEVVADYIVLGQISVPSSTFFKRIEALPPAHRAEAAAGRFTVDRYWDLPEEGEILVSSREEMREELRGMLDLAVRDRLRSPRASIQLSGGLDSTALAVVMLDELARSGGALSGLTMSHEALFEDHEPRLASMVGQRLGIPVSKVDVTDWKLWQDMADPGALTRERPGWGPFAAVWRAIFDAHAEAGPIVFSGDGGDYVMATERQPLRWWWKRGDLAGMSGAAIRAIRAGIPLRAGVRSKGPAVIPAATMPEWLDGGLAESSGIADRIRDDVIDDRVWTRLPRPTMRAELMRVRIDQELELAHPTVTNRAVVYSLPFFDRRLIERALCWAPYPWLDDKFVIRDTMRGRLPHEVLHRVKQGLAGDPLSRMIETGRTEDLPVGIDELSGLCDGGRFPMTPPTSDLATILMWCRAIETALWRRSLT